MPKIHDGDTPLAASTEPPEILKPFSALGFDLSWRPGQREGIGACPLCLGEGKFYVNTETGQWNCRKGCWSGNKDSLLQAVWDRSTFDSAQAVELAKSRTLLSPETLEQWGFRKLLTDGQWVTPGYSSGGKIVDLYRWVRDPQTKKHRLWSTPEYHHGIHGIPLFDKEKSNVLVCEGIWDGMAAWELLRDEYNVLAIPGANNLPDRCLPDLGGKEVALLFHSDFPKENKQSGQKMEPVGYQGMKRAAGILKGIHPEKAPKSIQYCYWGDDGYDPQKKDGFDIRDAIGHLSSPEDRRENLDALLCNLTAVPASWPVVKGGSEELTALLCTSWTHLQEAWQKAMEWTPGLDKTLAVCLASVVSTQTVGEQLWVKIMGPPSCGKSTIAEALAVAKKYVYSRDQLTGLHSGYKSDKEGTEDHSLLHKIIGKTFVLKDGDTLLQSSNLGQILSEFRAAYDGSSRVYYRHGLDRAYENFRFTWILLGTSSLRTLDSSELGARFVDCIVMDKIDAGLERKVLKYVVQKAIRNAAVVVNGKAETSQDIRLVRAKRLTGGYVNYLRENAGELMGAVDIPHENEELIMQCGEFVAFLRARESTKQKEVAEREFSSRLVEQYARLTICLAVVMGRPRVDDVVMSRVREIAMDTARGRSLNLVRYLYPLGQMGCDPAAARLVLGDDELTFAALLRYLRKIEVVEHFQATGAGWVGTRTRWRLTQRVRELYKAVAKP